MPVADAIHTITVDGVRMARTFSTFWRPDGRGAVIGPASFKADSLSAGSNGSPRIGSQPLLTRLMRMHRFGVSQCSVLTGCHYVVVALTNSIPLGS